MILFRRVLIVVQLVASIGVIVCTLVILAQLKPPAHQRPGVRQRADRLYRHGPYHLRTLAGFLLGTAALSFRAEYQHHAGRVGNIDMGGKLHARYREEKKEIWTKFMYVDTAFFSTFGVDMAQGNPRLREDGVNVILNQGAMAALQVDDYEQLSIQEESDDPDIPLHRVSGVYRDFNFKPLRQGVEPLTVYIVPIEAGLINVRVEVSSVDDIRRVFGAIEEIYKKFSPEQPLQIDMLDTYLSQLYHSAQRFKLIFGIFSVLAILISCVGLFGQIVFSNARRGKEIGVRKVQGATVGQIVGILIHSYLVYVGIALLIATPVAWYVMGQWLLNYPPGGVEPAVLYRGGLITLLVVVLTVGLHSWRAATVNPVRSLRSE